jgi:hypothetical protein
MSSRSIATLTSGNNLRSNENLCLSSEIGSCSVIVGFASLILSAQIRVTTFVMLTANRSLSSGISLLHDNRATVESQDDRLLATFLSASRGVYLVMV